MENESLQESVVCHPINPGGAGLVVARPKGLAR